jgi:branched-chain amino acid transport system ATP-binding protein
MTGDTILETRGLTKEFKGFVAVDHVNLKVRRGAIHALIGPNGAGKTTTFNLLTKFLQPTAGTIHFNEQDITRDSPADVARRGIIRSFQISAGLPQPHGPRERAHRAAAQPRHRASISGSARRASKC